MIFAKLFLQYLVPRPSPSTYPKEQRWRFIQRSITNDELLKFCECIAKCHGKKIDNVLPELLSFLPKEQRTKHDWLAIWVNILHQMGLGYTWDEGKYINSTELSNFVNQTKDIRSYYLYWGLKFQFPFSYPKQKHYVDNNVAIQPIVLILQYLKQLYELTNDVSKSYITKNEIAKFLMRSKNHQQILENSESIITLRKSRYDYSIEERSHRGFFEAGDHLFSRGKLFFKNVELLKFSGDKIIVKDKDHLKQIISFLSFVKQPIVFKENTQDMRNNYFSLVYDNLDPFPQVLSSGIRKIKKIPSKSPTVQAIVNPKDKRGLFGKGYASSRRFQTDLRKDLLVLYDNKCSVCGLDNPTFLITSHIVGVSIDPSIAADRTNCILLCVLHDIAFEEGLIYLDDKYKIRINKSDLGKTVHPLLKSEILSREGQKVKLPPRLKPKREYLGRHRKLHGF